MTPEQKELAGRFVACKHWRWMPGMLVCKSPDIAGSDYPSDIARLVDAERGVDDAMWATLEGDIQHGHGGEDRYWLPGLSLPDITDPATLGCILALVREATDDRRIHCRVRANVYRVYSGVSPVGRWMESEAEALLLALEAA